MKMQLIYIGLKKNNKEYFDIWAKFTENNGQPFVDTTMYNFSISNKLTDASPGQIYEFDYMHKNSNISVFGKTARYLGIWQNEEDIVKWQSAHRAVNAIYLSNLIAKQDKKFKFDFERLKPFREAFLNLNVEEKEIFMSQLICFITRPKGKHNEIR